MSSAARVPRCCSFTASAATGARGSRCSTGSLATITSWPSTCPATAARRRAPGDYSLGALASALRDLGGALGLDRATVDRPLARRRHRDAVRLPVPRALRAPRAGLQRRPRPRRRPRPSPGHASGQRALPLADRAGGSPLVDLAGGAGRLLRLRAAPDAEHLRARVHGARRARLARGVPRHAARGRRNARTARRRAGPPVPRRAHADADRVGRARRRAARRPRTAPPTRRSRAASWRSSRAPATFPSSTTPRVSSTVVDDFMATTEAVHVLDRALGRAAALGPRLSARPDGSYLLRVV